MHPVGYLFEEIYRDWGIPQAKQPVGRKLGFRWRGARSTRNDRKI
jgi:hypothetical protein